MKSWFVRHAFTATCILACWLAPAGATLIVPMSNDDLAASSEIVATGTVAEIRTVELATGRIATIVTIDLAEVWKGSPAAPFDLVEPGGIIGDRGEMVYGSPHYQLGEPVLVFAARGANGWQTNHMLQGKFRLRGNPDGSTSALREIGAGVAVLAGAATDWSNEIDLEELRSATAASDAAARTRDAVPSIDDLDIVGEVQSEFTLQNGNPRFFGADLGEPLRFVIDQRGDAILGLEVSRRAVDDAFDAWNAISGVSLELVDGGLTDDISTTPVEGVHKVLFNDPGNEIFDPAGCSGTLGIGGSQFSSVEVKTVNGATFQKILAAKITMADGWEGCPQWTECNFSEVAAHEGGHAFGLGHSSENPNEGNAVLRDALMYFRAQFDGRCADPREDDIGGIRFVYPDPAPIAITSESPLPEAIAGQPYSVQLEASGASGAVTWSRSGECDQSVAMFSISPSGLVTRPPVNVIGGACIGAIATDASGNSHQKRFNIALVESASSPTPTSPPQVPTATNTPRPDTPTHTATPRPPTPTFPPNRPCVGDCDGDGSISISELIRGVNIALGNADLSQCPSFDSNGDGSVAINELIQAVQAALAGCTEPV